MTSVYYAEVESKTAELFKVNKFPFERNNKRSFSLKQIFMRALEEVVIKMFGIAVCSASFLKSRLDTGGRIVRRVEMDSIKKNFNDEKITLVYKMKFESIAPSGARSLFVEKS
mgnify:CR=1 FL=1